MADQSLDSGMKEKVLEIIAEELEMDPGDIDESTSFVEEYEADSMSVIQVFGRVERELGVAIPQGEMENMSNLNAAYDIVGKYA